MPTLLQGWFNLLRVQGGLQLALQRGNCSQQADTNWHHLHEGCAPLGEREVLGWYKSWGQGFLCLEQGNYLKELG